MRMQRRHFLAASPALALQGISAWGPGGGQAAWPTRPIKGINPFQAGGPTNFLGRLIGDRLTPKLGQGLVM